MSDYDTAFDAAFPGVRADIEQRLSDRCTELAALEREIGRAYLAHRDTEDFIFDAVGMYVDLRARLEVLADELAARQWPRTSDASAAAEQIADELRAELRKEAK